MDMLCAAANKLGSEGAKALNPSLSESQSKLSHQASTTCLRGTGKAGLSVLAPVLPSLFPKAHCTSKSHTCCMLQLNFMFQKAVCGLIMNLGLILEARRFPKAVQLHLT